MPGETMDLVTNDAVLLAGAIASLLLLAVATGLAWMNWVRAGGDLREMLLIVRRCVVRPRPLPPGVIQKGPGHYLVGPERPLPPGFRARPRRKDKNT